MIVTDVVGRQMTTVDMSNISSEYKLDISNYKNGAYMIKLINDSGEYSARFIVNQ